MRPVNLIPPEERPGGQRPLRTGPIVYLIVGALSAALIGVTALMVTNDQIADRKSEVTQLEAEQATVNARAQALAPYTQFHTVQEQRVATMASLADSRFDWARVMDELSLVLPDNVWLSSLTGTASPGVSLAGGAGVSLRSLIPGPALELVGCASSQAAVAGFMQVLKDIDGVTRVGTPSSSLGSGGESSGSASASTCQTNDSVAQFQMVVAFDAAPVSVESTGEAVPAPEVETTAAEPTAGEGGEG
jgi:Tfp pilus assembly protein PilN